MGILSYWIAIFKNAIASLPFCSTKVLLFLPPDFYFLYSLVLSLPAAQSAAASGFVSFKKKTLSVNVRGLTVLTVQFFFNCPRKKQYDPEENT